MAVNFIWPKEIIVKITKRRKKEKIKKCWCLYKEKSMIVSVNNNIANTDLFTRNIYIYFYIWHVHSAHTLSVHSYNSARYFSIVFIS